MIVRIVNIRFIGCLDLSFQDYEQEEQYLSLYLLYDCRLVLDLLFHNYQVASRVVCLEVELQQVPEDHRPADLVVAEDNNNLAAVEVAAELDSILLSLELHNVLELYNIRSDQQVLIQ
jgi:hypothetical protein